MDQPFRISGIVEHGKGGRKLIPIDTMGQLMDAEGKASIFYIKCDGPANDDLVMQEIHATPRLRKQHVDHGRQLARSDDAQTRFPASMSLSM